MDKLNIAPIIEDTPTSFVFFSPTDIEPKKDTKLLKNTPTYSQDIKPNASRYLLLMKTLNNNGENSN